jgi:hypothetical protein
MRLFMPILVAGLTLPLSAFAIHCVENLNAVGSPTATPDVSELTTDQVASLTEMPKTISGKPALRVEGDVVAGSFPVLGKSPFQVMGLQTPRVYLRPKVSEVEGLLARPADQAALPAVTNNTHLKTRQRMMIYGLRGSGGRSIALAMNETIAAVAPIGELQRIAVTTRAEQKIGFATRQTDQQRTILVTVYLLEPAGHSYLSFRIPAKGEFPKVEVYAQAQTGLLLAVDDRVLQLSLQTDPATVLPGSVRVSKVAKGAILRRPRN